MRTTPLHDMHCHLAFMDNAEVVAAEARAAGSLLFANTVTPAQWRAARRRFAAFDNVIVGFGMHPWWVGGADDGEGAGGTRGAEGAEGAGGTSSEPNAPHAPSPTDVETALACDDPAFIGEVGLDFGKAHGATREAQLAVFRRIARWAGARGGKVLSIHAVHAAAEALDILARTGALESCTCIFHWYSGPSDQLKRAIDAGCLFSVGPRMTATRKGREYVKAIPAAQLLLETDDPPEQGQPYAFAALRANLETAATAVAAAKGEGALGIIEATSRSLLQP